MPVPLTDSPSLGEWSLRFQISLGLASRRLLMRFKVPVTGRSHLQWDSIWLPVQGTLGPSFWDCVNGGSPSSCSCSSRHSVGFPEEGASLQCGENYFSFCQEIHEFFWIILKMREFLLCLPSSPLSLPPNLPEDPSWAWGRVAAVPVGDFEELIFYLVIFRPLYPFPRK